MSIISSEQADEIFAAISKLREVMPEIQALSALIPGYGDKIVEGEKFLSRIFEMTSLLRNHSSHVDAAAELRKKTEEDWATALRRE